MPELPEVESVVRTLSPLVTGQRLLEILHLRADMVEPAGFDLTSAIQNRRIRSLTRRAKRIVFLLDDGNRFFIHLGMSGRLTCVAKDQPIKKHTHLIAKFSKDLQIRLVDPRRFGAIVWLGSSDHQNVGPEPFEMSPEQFYESIHKTKRSIKAALLDQNLIAGIGNIYADEALFLAGVRPQVRADRLSRKQSDRLLQSIVDVLNTAITKGGSTIRDYVDANGVKGDFQSHHNVYDRAGKPCRTCGNKIKGIRLAGRSTCFCMICQKIK